MAKIQDCDGKCLGACARTFAESDNPQLSAGGDAFAGAALYFGNGACWAPVMTSSAERTHGRPNKNPGGFPPGLFVVKPFLRDQG
jgi:hypothetical protein